MISFIGKAAENPDNVLEQAKGEYENVVIIGYDSEGRIDARASTNLNRMQILWMIEAFKSNTLMGRSDE